MTAFTTRIDAKFASLRAENKKAFVAYVMAGDPNYETSLEVVKGLLTHQSSSLAIITIQ